jgi:hypothetical protein
MSESIEQRCGELGSQIDSLERSIGDLISQASADERGSSARK